MENFFYAVFCLLVFLLGASIASFLCVLVEKRGILAEPKSPLQKRSICLNCEKQLRWHHLVPVFSFLFLRGRCANCKSKIPIALLISEILLGIFFLTIFFSPLYELENPLGLIFFSFIATFLFYLSYEDFLYQEIASWKLYFFVSLGFLSNLSFYLIEGGKNTENSFLIIFISTILYLFFIFFSVYGKDKYLGQGDFLVLLGLLFFYGLGDFLNIFIYSVWIGAIISIVYVYKKYGKYKKGVALPFIPFLFLGTLFFHITKYKIFKFEDILQIMSFLIK